MEPVGFAQGRLKDRYKMERKLGRIQERYPQVNDLYQVALEDTAAGLRLVWEIKAERSSGGICEKGRTCGWRIAAATGNVAMLHTLTCLTSTYQFQTGYC